MCPKYAIIIALLYYICVFDNRVFFAKGEKRVKYISVERPFIQFYDKRYINYINMTTFRFSRRNPVYYMNMFLDIKLQMDNRYQASVMKQISFYFYEFLSNRYQRSFVEMHMKVCDLINKDLFFGAALKQGKLAKPCPYLPGVYEMYNMTVLPDAIPEGFPFTKGRIVSNWTYLPTKDLIASGHVDMEIKTMKVKELKPYQKL